MTNARSPGSAGDLFRPGSSDAKKLANLTPGPAFVEVLDGLRLDLPEGRVQFDLQTLHRLVPLGVAGDLSYGRDQRALGGVQGFGHAMRVGVNLGYFKPVLDGGSESTYCLPQRHSQAVLEGVVHSHRPQSASGTTTKQNGPDTATLTSQAGPTTRNLCSVPLIADDNS